MEALPLRQTRTKKGENLQKGQTYFYSELGDVCADAQEAAVEAFQNCGIILSNEDINDLSDLLWNFAKTVVTVVH